MKLAKLIIPALLTFGMVGELAANEQPAQRVERVAAMADYTGDPDIDVGINVTTSASAAADWSVAQFYIDNFESRDVSSGDYLAFRMRSNNHGASYFDFIPNVSGTAYRVPISPAATGIKCVPAVPNGEAFDYGGARTWDLPMNFWDGADVWFCIPKTTFSRKYFGGDAIDWTQSFSAVYFLFYGTTIDTVNFDLGKCINCYQKRKYYFNSIWRRGV